MIMGLVMKDFLSANFVQKINLKNTFEFFESLDSRTASHGQQFQSCVLEIRSKFVRGMGNAP